MINNENYNHKSEIKHKLTASKPTGLYKQVKKRTKSLQKKKKIRGKTKYRFELSPSKQPTKYKALWDLEDKLRDGFYLADITGGLELVDSYYTIYTSLYSSEYLWLDYSSYLYSVYELRSLSCYVDIRNISYIEDVYSEQVDSIYNDLYIYYKDILNRQGGRIDVIKLRNTCTWFIYHLNRAVVNNSLGLQLAYDRQFYTTFQFSGYVSGRVVQKLVDMLEFNGNLYVFKGYSLRDEVSTSKTGETTYSGNLKRANTLLLLRGGLSKYCHSSPIKNSVTKGFTPRVESNTLVEVRVKSKCKDIINEEDYPVEWLETLKESEDILASHQEKLRNSVISIGGYEIPELIFRRIWIGDINGHGRLYDNGTFQSKSKEMRKQILIDGCPTVTIDLSSLHPRLLYAMKGIALPDNFDPYPNLNVRVDEKRVAKFKKYYNLDKYNPKRALAKVTLLVLLNANSLVEAKEAILNKIKKDSRKGMTCQEGYMDFLGVPDDIDIHEVIKEVMEHNKGISEYFATGASKMLMNKDSCIIVEAVNMLTQIDQASLPLHDSLTVREDCIEDTVIALKHGYTQVVGSLINFKCDIE